jgi:tetratricopeptide (TPR) repeat protein
MKILKIFGIVLFTSVLLTSKAISQEQNNEKPIDIQIENKNEDINKSIDALTKKINENSNDLNSYLARAKLYYQEKEYELSINDYKKAWELDPLNPEISGALRNVTRDYGLALIKQGKHKEGTEKLKEAMSIGMTKSLREDDNSAFYLYQAANYFKEEPEKSIALLKKVNKSSPLFKEANDLLIESYVNLSLKLLKKKKYEEAQNNLINGNKLLDEIENKTEKQQKIKDYIGEALKLSYPFVIYELGSQKKYKEVIFQANEFLKIEPNNSYAYIWKAYSTFKLGKNEEGINLGITAVKLFPDEANAYYNLACIYSLNQNKSLALKNLKKSIELSSKSIKRAISDKDFDFIRNDKEFKKLIK